MPKFGIFRFGVQSDQGPDSYDIFGATKADGVASGTQPILSDQFFSLPTLGQLKITLSTVEPH